MGFLVNSFIEFPETGFEDLSELYAYYKFDASGGNIVNQASAVGSTDQIASTDMAITGAAYSQTGIIDDALSFDGTNDYGTLGTSLSSWNFFHGTGDWSINFWINFTAYDNEARLFSNLGGSETSGIKFRLGSDTESLGIAIWNDSGQAMANGDLAVDPAFSTGTWTMITLTCDYSDASNCYEIFVNGESQSTRARSYVGGSGNAQNSLKTMTKGDASANFVNGLQDELSIWGRLLTNDEITQLYNSGDALAL